MIGLITDANPANHIIRTEMEDINEYKRKVFTIPY